MSKRYLIVGVTALAALWLYIDRVCFSTLADPIQKDLAVSDAEKEFILGAFFFTYALFQIPMGALADRFGARTVLTLSIAAWSLVTLATGFAQTFFALVAIRLMLGVTEAGAYPAAAGLIKNWARPEERGRFSSVVALGGRIGGASAPWLTATLAAALVGVGLASWSNNPAGVNWRGVFVLYGLCGLAVACLFWLVVRDRPVFPSPLAGEGGESSSRVRGETSRPVEAHPSPPAPLPAPAQQDRGSERGAARASDGERGEKPALTFLQRLGLLARTRNMWLYGAMQFGVNIGWVFLVTLLPTYLNKQFGVPLEERGRMQSIVLITGCIGMFFGGMLTDAFRAWLGPRRGRSVPLGITLGGCALAFFLIPTLPTVWAVIVALGVMAFLVDLHNPTVWSFAQDVGGKNVGAALGFGNMWGNLGGALSPVLLGGVARVAGWDTAFVVCGCAFTAAACCGLLLDATKPVDAADA